MDRERLQRLEEQCIQNEPPACEAACPVHVAVKPMLAVAAQGDWDAARGEFTRAVPFPHVIAACCDAPCQAACVRGEVGGAIRIRELERATLRYGGERAQGTVMRRRKPGRVAVVGAGMCGLSAAYELARKGYSVTVLEAREAAGGQACDVGAEILAAADLAADVARVVEAGAEIVTGTTVALDVPRAADAVAAFAPDAAAVLLAVGPAQTGAGAPFGCRVDQRGAVVVDPVTLETSVDGVFAGGGVLRPGEPWSPITSIADGRRAALSIDRRMQGVSLAASREDRGAYQTRLVADLEDVVAEAPVTAADPAAGFSVDEAAAEAARCLQCECLRCVKACAYLEEFGSYPGRYARHVYNNLAVTRGRGTRSANKMIDSCSLCRLCYEVCPTDLDWAEVAHDARREMVRQDRMPASAFGFALEDLALATGDDFALARHAPGTDTSDVVFFPGCQLAASDPEHLERVYSHLRERYAPATGLLLYCCGAPADWAGRSGVYEETLTGLRERLDDLGARKVVLACPTCETVFAARLPGVETVSLWEVLREVGPPEGAAGSGAGRRVAVHDACTARYQASVQAAVRELLAICDYEVEELAYGRERTECCGFGGLMLYANPGLGDVVAERRVRESEADYVAYCAMCRDRYAARGKPTVHMLDLLFGDDFDTRARRRGPGLAQRAGRRAALKRRLLVDVWGEAAPPGDAQAALRMSPEVEDLLERRFVRPEEALAVIAHGEETGRRFEESDTGHRLATLPIGSVTYWVEYEIEDGDYRVHTAYSHRMQAKPPPWPPAEEWEHDDGRVWRCALGDHPLEARSVTLTYLVAGFPVKLPACVDHGMVLITEALATGRMLEAELALEDK
ncbi:MAG TPA: FAD-dependent oxidoreductase [Thermoleophilia bacterium]|nr:FAD-dependent oxidoreductase [Thermoleophilia bacterium]